MDKRKYLKGHHDISGQIKFKWISKSNQITLNAKSKTELEVGKTVLLVFLKEKERDVFNEGKPVTFKAI